MRDFKDYMYEQYVNEGLGELLSKFWDWLTRSKNYKKYDQYDDEYDETAKKKYISSKLDSSIRVVEFKNEKELSKVIDNTIDPDDPRVGFTKTYAYINKHLNKQSKSHMRKWKLIDEKYRWIGFVFNTKRLKEVFGIVAHSYDKETDTTEIYFSEFLRVYSDEIDYEKICDELRLLADKVYVSDENLVKLLKKNDIDLEEDKDKKGFYVLS